MNLKTWRNFDYLMFLMTLALIGYGLAMNYTASRSGSVARDQLLGSPVFRQALFALAGLVLMAVIAYVDYGVFGKLAVAGYVFTILSLVGVIVIGEAAHGSRRWVD